MPTKLESIDTTASFLWNLPGLDQSQFYSAAYYLSLKQRQQKGSQQTHESYLSSGMKELAQDDNNTTIKNVFLDRLALLFARFKHKAKTPANVTATGLVIHGNELIFYLCKNGGPVAGDEAFADMLQEWFNSEPVDGLEGPGEDQIWKGMVYFWEDRVTHYAKEIVEGPGMIEMRGIFERLEGKVEMETPKKDWEQTIELSANLKQWAYDSHQNLKEKKRRSTKRRITFPFEAFQACYNFWRRDSRQDYLVVDNATKRFDKRIHNIEMLGLLFSTWKACHSMRINRGNSSIRFEFVQKLPDFRLVKSELESTIIRWQGSHKFLRDKPLDGLHEVKVVSSADIAGGLKDEPSSEPPYFTQYFHCELQMLQLFHQLKDKGTHWHIGCSKLSCHFCSKILENGRKHGQKYQTRSSHYKISPNCAFPFSISDGMGYISEALLSVQFEMLQNVHRYAASIKDQFTEYSDKKDTEQGPTENSGSAMTVASKVVKHEELLNWARLQNESSKRYMARSQLEQTPREVKALKLSSDGSETFESVQVIENKALLGYSSYEWFERQVGVQKKEFFLFLRYDEALPVNQWVVSRTYKLAYSWGTAVKHCRFRGDFYLVYNTGGRRYGLQDVDAMDELDETFVNYEMSMGRGSSSDWLWLHTWNGLAEQLVQFFGKDLQNSIRNEEERERYAKEEQLRKAHEVIADIGSGKYSSRYNKYRILDY